MGASEGFSFLTQSVATEINKKMKSKNKTCNRKKRRTMKLETRLKNNTFENTVK